MSAKSSADSRSSGRQRRRLFVHRPSRQSPAWPLSSPSLTTAGTGRSSSIVAASSVDEDRQQQRLPRFYNEDGKASTRLERAQSARILDGRLFARMVTSPDTLLRLRAETVALARPQTSPWCWSRPPPPTPPPPPEFSIQRVMAARAVRNFQAKSARARLRTTQSPAGGVAAAAAAAAAGAGPHEQRRHSDDSLSSCQSSEHCSSSCSSGQPVDNTDAGAATASGQGKDDDGAESDASCESCLAMVMAQRAGVEKPQAAVGPTGKKPALRLAMADFTRKIEDNEGTEISTFSYMAENQLASDEGQSADDAVQDVIADVMAGGSLDGEAELPPSFSDISEASRKELKEAAKKLHKHKQKFKHMSPLNRLRRAVKTVNLLIKACTTKEEQTRKNQMRMMTFSDIASNLAEESKREELTFQLSYYKAKKEMTLSAEAQDILRQHPFLRTKEMLHTAMVSLQTAVEAFSEFPTNMKQSLVRVGWYEKFSANQVIIRQGHNALNYYFIISGTTAVSVALKKPSGEPFNKTVAFLRKGESFGELALLYGGKRSATVYCKDEVELLAVSREDFIDIFMNLDTEEEPEHISFLREIPAMVGWPIDQLPYDNPKVCMFAYFRKGIVLCRDSNSADFVYIVKSGHCLVMKDLQPCASTIPRLRSRQRMCDSYPVEEDSSAQRYVEFLNKDCLSDPMAMRGGSSKSRLPRVVAKPSGRLYIQLKVLQRRDTFGLEPIAFRVFGATTSVTLVSMGAECILISKDFFLKNMTERYYQMIRREIQAFPTMESLNEKFQSYYNWDAYKGTLVDFLVRPKSREVTSSRKVKAAE